MSVWKHETNIFLFHLLQEVIERVDRFSNGSCHDDEENFESIYTEDVSLTYTIQVLIG